MILLFEISESSFWTVTVGLMGLSASGAVMIYNNFNKKIEKIEEKVENFSERMIKNETNIGNIENNFKRLENLIIENHKELRKEIKDLLKQS